MFSVCLAVLIETTVKSKVDRRCLILRLPESGATSGPGGFPAVALSSAPLTDNIHDSQLRQSAICKDRRAVTRHSE